MEHRLADRLATQADLEARVLTAAKTEVRVPLRVPPKSVAQPTAKVEPTPTPEPESMTAPEEPEAPSWPDEASESAFLADARERGETVGFKAVDVPEPSDEAKALPTLDSLVERIPSDVRDTLENLFRAKFIRVQRVPQRALKK